MPEANIRTQEDRAHRSHSKRAVEPKKKPTSIQAKNAKKNAQQLAGVGEKPALLAGVRKKAGEMDRGKTRPMTGSPRLIRCRLNKGPLRVLCSLDRTIPHIAYFYPQLPGTTSDLQAYTLETKAD